MFTSTSQTATQSAKFIACGPTAFQRSPTPMQPRMGRSCLEVVFASWAMVFGVHGKYGAEARPAAAAEDWRKTRRDEREDLRDIQGLTFVAKDGEEVFGRERVSLAGG